MGEFVRDRLPDAVAYFEGEGLRLFGPGKWKSTRCDFHDGGDSMRINTETGGWVCMSCGTKGGDVVAYQMQRHGQEFIEAAQALGCWDESAPRGNVRHKPRNFSPLAAVQVLRFEMLLGVVAACNLAKGVALTDADRARLIEAAARINLITEEFA